MEGIDDKTANSLNNNLEVVSNTVDENLHKDKVVFRVQIETSETKISSTSSKFKGIKVFEYKQDNLYKYTFGEYEKDFAGANKYKNELREMGYQHAFVVAFLNGERINLEKAIKLAEN